ncbi:MULTISPECIES: HAMP domain-containing sensor histidine kinase [unclassified Acinetobacter]|uniref:sensor histidine kinase n=1 Tax=unclassified Acinetobacter TaxID=196816 RepID=UPI0015D15027|nr:MULTISPECIES: ATP-binding protein [unclassified Acinetobacter]UUS64270.1 ATP-binding protein [Acinetobacter sp. YH12068_T]
MSDKKSISLQSQLIKTSLLSAIWAGAISLCLMLGFGLYHIMNVHDALMDEVADMLTATDLTLKQDEQIDELSEEFDMQYQLMQGSQVLTTSEQHTAFEHQPNLKQGLHYQWGEGALWRSYALQDDGLSVQIIQPMKTRLRETLQSVLGYAGILLIVWLIQWLLLHILIKRQLKVLQLFSKQIAEKNVDDLQAIVLPEPVLQELEPIQTQLNFLLSRLDQALEAEQRFTSDASHELRSPLSAIQMRLQVLKRKYPNIQQDLLSIQHDVNRGTRVLENLLILARLDPTQSEQLDKKQNDLEQLSLQVIDALQPFIEEKQIELKLQTQSVQFAMNAELMFSCLRNLVDNAIRYSPEQGQVKIDLTVTAQQAIWTIENQGAGLTAAELQRIGERFYRVLGTKTQGSGLGISIAQKIAQLHQGHLSVDASELGGLKVQLTFPIR